MNENLEFEKVLIGVNVDKDWKENLQVISASYGYFSISEYMRRIIWEAIERDYKKAHAIMDYKLAIHYKEHGFNFPPISESEVDSGDIPPEYVREEAHLSIKIPKDPLLE